MTVAAVSFWRAASCRLLYSEMTVPFLSHFNTRLLFLSYLRLKPGSTYNESKFLETRSIIQNLYYENGYTSNRFGIETHKDTENLVVSYTMNIQENARSHVEKIIIKGNEKTKDFVAGFEAAMEDDFNTADAVSAVFEMVKAVNVGITENASMEAAEKAAEAKYWRAKFRAYALKKGDKKVADLAGDDPAKYNEDLLGDDEDLVF